ncbi:MAG: hypothetical protein AAF280_03985 [Pseudomonadota bacterium]
MTPKVFRGNAENKPKANIIDQLKTPGLGRLDLLKHLVRKAFFWRTSPAPLCLAKRAREPPGSKQVGFPRAFLGTRSVRYPKRRQSISALARCHMCLLVTWNEPFAKVNVVNSNLITRSNFFPVGLKKNDLRRAFALISRYAAD